jgi:peptidoglycan/LPS O-acetylase OafA/YrhL
VFLAGSLVTPVLLAHSDVPDSWKPIHHFSDFVAGIVAARLYDFLLPRMHRRGNWLYLPALIGGAFLIVYPHTMDPTYGDLNTGLRPLNVLALAGLALGGGFAARILSTPAADYLGKISYSMYILHVPVLWWYGRWALHGSVFGMLHISRPVAAVLYVALVILISGLSFRWVEMPANRRIREFVASRLSFRPALAAEPVAA